MLCECLYLKSNTITPLLKKLEEKGYITKEKDKEDERNLVITLTNKGEQLKEKAVDVPISLAKEMNLSPEKAQMLYNTLYELLGSYALNIQVDSILQKGRCCNNQWNLPPILGFSRIQLGDLLPRYRLTMLWSRLSYDVRRVAYRLVNYANDMPTNRRMPP